MSNLFYIIYFIYIYFNVNIIFFFFYKMKCAIFLHIKDDKGTLKSRINNSFLHTLVHIFYNMVFPLACIVTVIFCGLMLPKLQTFYYNFIHYSQQAVQHVLQSVFLGIDWFLITVPSKPTHFLPTFVVGVIYLIFVQIYHVV